MSQQMVDFTGPEWHSYRCPVCGHTDEVDMKGATGVVACSHCGTELEVSSRSREEAAAAVKVAVRRRRVH